MSNNLKVLADNRDALLLAEIASWLHMLGKLHEECVAGDHGIDIKIPKDVKNDFSELYTLLITSWTGKVWNFHRDNDPMPEFQAKNLSIFDLIKYHRTSMKS